MIERLQRALGHVEELPAPVQEELAEQIERYLEPFDAPQGTLADSPPTVPDDEEATRLRWRQASVLRSETASRSPWDTIYGLAATESEAPTDEQVAQWLDEHRMEKYAR